MEPHLKEKSAWECNKLKMKQCVTQLSDHFLELKEVRWASGGGLGVDETDTTGENAASIH